MPTTDRVISAQKVALAAARGVPPTIAGITVAPAEWFTAVKVLAAMIRFSQFPGAPVTNPAETAWSTALAFQYRQRRDDGVANPGDLRAMPSTPELAAGLLLAVGAILGAADVETCADALSGLAVATFRKQRDTHHNPFRSMPTPTPLASVLSRFTKPTSRVAGAASRAKASSVVTARNVPHLLNTTDYHDLVAGYLPGTAESTGRRFAALSVVRRLGATSWPHAAELLDMDPRKAALAVNVVVRRIHDVAAFWAGIDGIIARLGECDLIDYTTRRRCLAHLYEVPYPVLRAASDGRRFPITPGRRRHAAAWIWAQSTGGDVREAPAYSQGWNATTESVRDAARRFAHGLPAPVAVALNDWAANILLRETTG